MTPSQIRYGSKWVEEQAEGSISQEGFETLLLGL